jgi:hypothetical protein
MGLSLFMKYPYILTALALEFMANFPDAKIAAV